MIGEGIESSLSAIEASGKPAWAALSTTGLKTLDPPPSVQQIILLADGDAAGETAAAVAARRWTLEGRAVEIARPRWGGDFNDLLRTNCSDHEGHTE